ncbi:MAG: elongation factor P [Patescibacteria group bacterium]|nr:elongation factor P [Patescibacteria group bacterium]
MALLSNNDLRKGVVFKHDSDVFVVLKYEHCFRGRGSGLVKLRVRNIKTGAVTEKKYREGDKISSVDTRKSTIQYLYTDVKNAVFMDMQTFEQFELPEEMLSESLKYLKEGEKVIALYLNDKVVSIEVPGVVNLAIEYTEPAVKGDTANNAVKKATLENGLEINVPLFSKVGDIVKINTESGEYIARVKK